ncbi:MAG: acyl-CoA dehydratase activase-related protein [Clostridia bacterium]|nr:acyl-CoA dehydratase activase-related protein [Clostridia bacterium]
MSLVAGVPRGLLYYEYGAFMEEFLEQCGVGVVLSRPTDKSIVDQGVRLCVDGACLPVKVFFGHAHSISDKVDVLFIPRFVSVERRAYICPKLMGLPDMVRARMRHAPRVVDPLVDLSHGPEGLVRSAFDLGRALGIGGLCGAKALAHAARVHRKRKMTGMAVRSSGPGADISIGVLGHSYNLDDRFVSLDLINKLAALGAEPVTPSAYSDRELAQWEMWANGRKRLFWTLGRRLMGAANRWYATGEVDGVVHMMSFGCGPESFIADVVRRQAALRPEVPFMLLNSDEHSGEAGLATRLEAFVDTVRMRRRGLGDHVSPHREPLDTR